MEATFTYIVGVVAITKAVSDVVGHKAGPLTGHQYVEAGAKYLDTTLAILNDEERGGAIRPPKRLEYITQHAKLNKSRDILEETTRTYSGSYNNRSKGRHFYLEANRLEMRTRSDSDQGIADKLKQSLLNGRQPPDLYFHSNDNMPSIGEDEILEPKPEGPGDEENQLGSESSLSYYIQPIQLAHLHGQHQSSAGHVQSRIIDVKA